MSTCTGGCGRELSPNDVRLGYCTCKECQTTVPTDSPEQIAAALDEFSRLGHQLYHNGGNIHSRPQRRALIARRSQLRQYLAAQGVMTNAVAQ